jgi:hypothetical protein
MLPFGDFDAILSPGVSGVRAWYTDSLGLVSKSIQGGPWRYASGA